MKTFLVLVFCFFACNSNSQNIYLDALRLDSTINERNIVKFTYILRKYIDEKDTVRYPTLKNLYLQNTFLSPYLESLFNSEIEKIIINNDSTFINLYKSLNNDEKSFYEKKDELDNNKKKLGLESDSIIIDSISKQNGKLTIDTANISKKIGKYKQQIDSIKQEMNCADLKIIKTIDDNFNYPLTNIEDRRLSFFDFSCPPPISIQPTQININQASSQSTVVGVASSFIAERMKDEINIVFINNFKKKLLSKPEYKIIFPNTFLLLKYIENYDYTNILQILKEAFIIDIKDMPFNILELDQFKSENTNIFYNWTYLALLSIKKFNEGNHPYTIFNDIDEENSNNKTWAKNAFYLLNEMSKSLVDYDNEKFTWLSEEKFSLLIKNDTLLNCFLGLLQRKMKNSDNVNLKNIITKPKLFKSLLISFYDILVTMDNQLFLIKEAKTNSGIITIDNIRPLYKEFNNILFFTAQNLADNNQICEKTIISITKNAFNILDGISTDNYSSILSNTIIMLNTIDPSFLNDYYNYGFIKYGTFMVSIATSKNAEEMKNAFNAATLPAGSYSIKRKSYSTICLNAYPGINGGFEYAYNNEKNQWAGNLGFMAPVGFDWSWGTKTRLNTVNKESKFYGNKSFTKKNKNKVLRNNSSGLFISIFDFGAPVQFRLSNDTAQIPEKLALKDFVAPGLFFVKGFKNTPISLLSGIQYSPLLREFYNNKKANALRFNIAFTIDIPIINFYNKTDKLPKSDKNQETVHSN